jgi:hypothetical protein
MRDIIIKLQVAMFETALNPDNPSEDYAAKLKALQDLQTDPASDDPTIKQAIMQRLADLKKEAEEKGLSVKEAFDDSSEYDDEAGMAKGQLTTAEAAAAELRSILDADENLPEWVQSKITMAVDYLDTARDYMKSKDNQDSL